MAAYFTTSTVISSILLLLACGGTILSGLGGMNRSFLANIPWLNGQITVNGVTTAQTKLPSIQFWMGIWNYCILEPVFKNIQCDSLVNGSQNELALLTGKSSTSNSNDFPATLIVALPYLNIGSAVVLLFVFGLTFVVKPPTATVLTLLATAVSGATYASAVYLVMSVRKKLDSSFKTPQSLNDIVSNESWAAFLGTQQNSFGPSFWLGGASVLVVFISFCCYLFTTCRGRWRDHYKYRDSIYY